MHSNFKHMTTAAALALSAATIATALASEPIAERIPAAQAFANHQVVQLDVPDMLPDSLQIATTIDGAPATLMLSKRSLRSDDFQLLEDRGNGNLVAVAPPPVRTYRGIVDGYSDSLVSLTLGERGLSGRIRVGEQRYWMQPLSDFDTNAARGEHVLYRSEDVLHRTGTCGVVDEAPSAHLNDAVAPQPTGGPQPHRCDDPTRAHGEATDPPVVDRGGGSSIGGYYKVKIAFDVDYEFYDRQDNDSSQVLTWIDTHMNDLDAIYESEVGICYTYPTVIVRTTTSDPYSATDAGDRLAQLDTEWTNNRSGVTRLMTHLLTAVELDGSTVGIARIPGVSCFGVSNAYALSQDIGVGAGVYYQSVQVELIAHELGHNWSAPHESCGIMTSGLPGGSQGRTDFCESSENAITSHLASNLSCSACVSGGYCPEPCACGTTYVVGPVGAAAIIQTYLIISDCGSQILLIGNPVADFANGTVLSGNNVLILGTGTFR